MTATDRSAVVVEYVEEHVVLLDDSGAAIGTAPKRSVHHQDTPLHLAFSCYVFDVSGRLLVTQRAKSKRTWPGVWTNSLCGHPAPGESILTAVARRARRELGIDVRDIRVAVPAFRYRAVMTNGIVEHEVCPVFTAITGDQPDPASDEVEGYTWTAWDDFCDEVLDGTRQVSPWCAEQTALLTQLGAHPRAIHQDWTALPAAATTARR